ncbi:MAG: phosphate ABC transporter permease PstA [Nitrososphaerota archaeon]|nr:phosphate ABC transporter permease PstA [Nitrososphaerota archaeon]
MTGLTILSILIVLIPLADIIYLFVIRGLEVISWAALTTITVGTGVEFVGGGIANAISGTVVLMLLATAMTVPLGLLGGIYMAEFSNNNRFSEALRFVADVLAGNSSMVVGLAGYFVFVLYFGWGYSALAGALTLSILMFPYVFRTTELALRKVSNDIRDAAKALGSTKTTMINRLTLRYAMPGIITGVLLSISIGLSETAPLLFTASFSNYNFNGNLLHTPVGFLTYVVYVYSQLPSNSAHNLAFLSSFLLITSILVINVVARVVVRRFSKV